MSIRPPLLFCLSMLSSSIYAVDSGIAPLGFSGALSTPTAATLSVGQAGLAFSPYLDGQGVDVDGYNYLAGAGLLSGVEVFGRLATNTVADHCGEEYCGLRDLSASVKVRLPDASVLLNRARPNWMPDLAVGATDLGGAATYFRSYYGVATWDRAWWAASLGLAHASSASGRPQARLDGPFASVVAQPLPWLQGVLEYDGQDPQVGVRLITPDTLLPLGMQAQAEVRSGAAKDNNDKKNVGQTNSGRDVWWGISATVPLDFSHRQRPTHGLNHQDRPAPQNKAASETHSMSVPAATMAVSASSNPAILNVEPSVRADQRMATARLQAAGELANRLQAKGFENIRVGYQADRWIVAVENQAYQWNTLDALGVALGVFSQWAGQGQSDNQLTLTIEQQEQPVLTIDTDQACVSAWLNDASICGAGVIRPSTQAADLQGWQRANPWAADSQPWLIRNQAPMRYRPQLSLAPVLNYALGTEYGSLDYSLGLSSTLEVPLFWSGLMADVRYISVITESKDYQGRGVFASSALQEGIDRAMLHQYLQGPYGLSAHFAAGQMYHDYRGALAEGQWQSASGAHQLSLLAGGFNQSSSDATGRPIIAGYRYQLPYSDIQFGIKAGEFFDGDRGYLLDSRFAYGDTFISLFYQSSKHPSDGSVQSYAGVQLSLPLGMRQNLPMRYGQVGGTAEYNQSIKTEVNNRVNRVIGANQYGRLATAPQSLDLQVNNRDRRSLQYFEQHLDRARQAYQRYVLSTD